MSDTPRGYFERILAFDSETTGLCFSNDNPVHNPNTGERHQVLSWGFIVADAKTFKPIDELYLEVKWNESSLQQRKDNPEFGKVAEGIHGLTFNYLEKNAVSEEEALVEIANFLIRYWGPSNTVKTLGHNSITFDLPFLQDMFARYGVDARFGNRHYDSTSLAFGTIGAFNSDDMFNTMGLGDRDIHNALEDARLTLKTFELIHTLWTAKVGLTAYD